MLRLPCSSLPLRCCCCSLLSPPRRRRLHHAPEISSPPSYFQRATNGERRRRKNNVSKSLPVSAELLLSTLSSSSSSSFSDSAVSAIEALKMPPLSLSFLSLSPGEKHALTLSTLAGMSTTLGALLAIIRRPNAADLAFLLGVALGVMGVLSVCEMWLHNAYENGLAPVTLAFAGGAGAYCLLAPLLPEISTGGRWGIGGGGDENGEEEMAREGRRKKKKKVEEKAPVDDASEKDKLSAAKGGAATTSEETPPPPPLKPAQLLRLGLVVAVAMTAHNLPEGFAVAFSSFTPLGPAMAWAIAAHNIPEGVVVAAPVYAATGSRLAALGLAAASGMSEPVGAAAALFLARPWLLGGAGAEGAVGTASSPGALAAAAALAEARLALVLAASGGVMAAVCAVDLYPQGKKCAAPGRLALGGVLGGLAMAATLALGV